jgi:hypothetical protein
MVIWKFPLKREINTIEMPTGAMIMTVANQQDNPTLWAMVDPKAPKEVRTFQVIGTGFDFNQEGLTFLGTAHGIMGYMVFHVFEKR